MPDKKKMLVRHMLTYSEVSLRKAYHAVQIPRSSFSYKTKPMDDEEVIKALSELVHKHPSIGFRKC